MSEYTQPDGPVAKAHVRDPLTLDGFFKPKGPFYGEFTDVVVCDEAISEALPAQSTGTVRRMWEASNEIGPHALHIAILVEPRMGEDGIPMSRDVVILPETLQFEIGDGV